MHPFRVGPTQQPRDQSPFLESQRQTIGLTLQFSTFRERIMYQGSLSLPGSHKATEPALLYTILQ